MSYRTFSRTYGGVNLAIALNCVQYDVMRLRGTATDPRILLCVDELMQCADEEADCRALVNRIGSCMDYEQSGREDRL